MTQDKVVTKVDNINFMHGNTVADVKYIDLFLRKI